MVVAVVFLLLFLLHVVVVVVVVVSGVAAVKCIKEAFDGSSWSSIRHGGFVWPFQVSHLWGFAM